MIVISLPEVVRFAKNSPVVQHLDVEGAQVSQCGQGSGPGTSRFTGCAVIGSNIVGRDCFLRVKEVIIKGARDVLGYQLQILKTILDR